MSTTPTSRTELDDKFGEVHPDNCDHVYGYDANGRLITDTITNKKKTATWVKTFTYDGNGRLATESGWVRQ